jgi:hypothetical protein
MKDADIEPFFATLKAANPMPASELEYSTVFELLVAVLLSAQATDAGVNKATRRLFHVANTPQAILALGREGLEEYIRTIGLYRMKAKHLLETCRILVERHGGQVPRDREALEALPGVGRKTANVVLNVAWGGAQRRLGRGGDGGGHAHLPRQQPHRPRARQEPGGGGAAPDGARPQALPGRCPSLAHPAWPLRLRGAPAQVLAVRGGALVRLRTEDAAAGSAGLSLSQ